jgi:hypothetical protein
MLFLSLKKRRPASADRRSTKLKVNVFKNGAVRSAARLINQTIRLTFH